MKIGKFFIWQQCERSALLRGDEERTAGGVGGIGNDGDREGFAETPLKVDGADEAGLDGVEGVEADGEYGDFSDFLNEGDEKSPEEQGEDDCKGGAGVGGDGGAGGVVIGEMGVENVEGNPGEGCDGDEEGGDEEFLAAGRDANVDAVAPLCAGVAAA